MNLKNAVRRNAINLPGTYLSQKIVVIESDDWGAIRMPSYEVYNRLLSQGYPVDRCPYEKNDRLASAEDLSALFEVLSKYRDYEGRHPVVTAVCVVADPDFERIRESDFSDYFYEPITRTLERSKEYTGTFGLWEEGIKRNLFRPQFHGREHLNVKEWMQALRSGDKGVHRAFKCGMAGVSPKGSGHIRNPFMAALKCRSAEELESYRFILKEGLQLFEQLFGFRSLSFMAPCYTWHPGIEKILSENGVKFLQSAFYQNVPGIDGCKNSVKHHYFGQQNHYGQFYLLRNCLFEPTQNSGKDNIGECLSEIKTAFRWGKPATIFSHRLKHIKSIVRKNRENYLKLLDNLLSAILKKWPDVLFLSSDQLGKNYNRN